MHPPAPQLEAAALQQIGVRPEAADSPENRSLLGGALLCSKV